MAPAGPVAAGWAKADRGGGGTAGFQPVICPDSEAKRNTAGPVAVPDLTTKSVGLVVVNGLNTVPVGAPPGMDTTRLFRCSGLVTPPVVTSPVYRVLTSAPLSETQNAALGDREMPHGLTRFGSWIVATPGWSATRLVCR